MAQPDSQGSRAAPPGLPQFRRGNLSGQLLLGAVAVALVVIAAYYVQNNRTPPPPRPVRPPDRITVLEQKVASDEARIARLESALKGANVGALAARTAALEKTQKTIVAGSPTSDIAGRLASFALKADEDALAGRVTKLEDQNSSVALESVAASLALANLMHASDEGADFSRELHALVPLMPEAPELRDLARYAKGAPTHADLAARFAQVADDVLAADRRALAKDWLGRLWVNLSSLVSIRRVGAAEGADTESRLARASARLRANDLEGAVQEIRALNGAARASAAPWLAAAEARLAIDRDETALSDRLAQELVARSGHAP